jgi:hypothetical protein
LAIGPLVTQIKPGDMFVIHEYDKINQGEGWAEDELLFCREGKILYIPDSLTEVTERDRDLSTEEEQEIVDVL